MKVNFKSSAAVCGGISPHMEPDGLRSAQKKPSRNFSTVSRWQGTTEWFVAALNRRDVMCSAIGKWQVTNNDRIRLDNADHFQLTGPTRSALIFATAQCCYISSQNTAGY